MGKNVVVIGTQHVKLHGNTIYKPYGHGFIVDQADDSAQILAHGAIAGSMYFVRLPDRLQAWQLTETGD